MVGRVWVIFPGRHLVDDVGQILPSDWVSAFFNEMQCVLISYFPGKVQKFVALIFTILCEMIQWSKSVSKEGTRLMIDLLYIQGTPCVNLYYSVVFLRFFSH